MKVLAIDIGATTIKYAIYSAAGRGYSGASGTKIKGLETVRFAPTPKNREKFSRVLKEIIISHQGKFSAIAVCVPGMINYSNGAVINFPNISFLNGFNLYKFLRRFSKSVQIDNDAKCFLRAEAEFGAARKCKSVVLLAIGTGIGGAMMFGRKIYYGHSSAGEIGHTIIDGKKTLEQLASGRTALKHRKKDFQRIGFSLGVGLANIINVFGPEAVIISGGFAHNQGRHFLPLAKKVAYKHLIDPRAKKTPIVQGQLGPNAAILGAALLFE